MYNQNAVHKEEGQNITEKWSFMFTIVSEED